jgi:N-acetylglucosamine kinase-like BadF-type ATPase
MDREPLVTLPPALARFGAASPAEPVGGAGSGLDSSDGPPTRAGARARKDHLFLLGIDGGATKTLAAVLDVEHGALHLGRGGPSNQDSAGVAAAGQALFDAADAALAGAGIGDEDLDAAVLAVAGTDTGAVAAHVRQERSAEWIVVNDVVGAWATATGARPGVAAISGTGSNVFGVGADGRAWRAGGWGHVLGDEGSGYWIGVEAIKAALRDRDGSGPKTALSEAAIDFFAVPTIEALATTVYSKPLTKSEIAAFAATASALAERGDAEARTVYERGAAELASRIAAVIRETALEGAFPVGLIGSAFKAGPVFVEPLARAVHAVAPEAEVKVVGTAPVAGSLLLAARARGAEEALVGIDLAALIEGASQQDG